MGDAISYLMKSSTAQTMTALKSNLAKAKDYTVDMEIDESVLLNMRLYPDMLPLVRQVQIAADTAIRGAARLVGIEPPGSDDSETTIEELIALLDKAHAYVDGLDSAAMDANERTEMEIPLGPMTLNWEGRQYLSTFVLPNLHFHASIVFALLRQAGLKIGKRDYLLG